MTLQVEPIGGETLDLRIAREIPNSANLLKAEKDAGTFTSLMDFYEKYRPSKPAGSPPAVAMLDLAVDSSLVDSLRIRAETAETALSDARQRIVLLETQASNDLTKARQRIADLESAERSTELSRQIAQLTSERDTALTKVTSTSRNMALLERFNGVRGLARGEAPPDIEEPKAEKTTAQWLAEHAAAKTPQEQSRIVSEMLAAADAKKAGK